MTEVNFCLPNTDRFGQRIQVVQQFLREDPGTGNGEFASKYRYNVEQYSDYIVYVERPAHLNKGFDFTVHVTNITLNRGSCPSHNDIIAFATDCKNTNPSTYHHVAEAINQVYNCRNYNQNTLNNICFHDKNRCEHPVQILLLIIKWLFIEQDITYWNYSGRHMLLSALQENGLA
ncbi:MAG: DNA adenine methylase [Bacillota bacterium]|nr:DNA adenine methylase [Bacillota bacterium]